MNITNKTFEEPKTNFNIKNKTNEPKITATTKPKGLIPDINDNVIKSSTNFM